MSTYLAIDLGAESGRGVVTTLSGGKVTMEEIHRFANRPVRLAGTLYWDFGFLFAEILATLKLCSTGREYLQTLTHERLRGTAVIDGNTFGIWGLRCLDRSALGIPRGCESVLLGGSLWLGDIWGHVVGNNG